MIPLSGYLSRVLSTRWMFVDLGRRLHVMSFMCATSSSIDEMIVWRALQGFIGGGMIPTVFASAFTIFPRSKQRDRHADDRPRGDAGADHRADGRRLSHRPAVLALAVPHQRRAGHLRDGLDLLPGRLRPAEPAPCSSPSTGPGSPSWRASSAALEYVLEEGPNHDWLQDESVVVCAVICAVSRRSAFFWRVFTAREPIVDLRAFADRNFAVGCCSASCSASASTG